MALNRLDKNYSITSGGKNILKKNNLHPRLSLHLHTMPQTPDSHFKKWLFLAIFIFFLIILLAFIIFWT